MEIDDILPCTVLRIFWVFVFFSRMYVNFTAKIFHGDPDFAVNMTAQKLLICTRGKEKEPMYFCALWER